eukprot:951854-Amphidinium_carterae.1
MGVPSEISCSGELVQPTDNTSVTKDEAPTFVCFHTEQIRRGWWRARMSEGHNQYVVADLKEGYESITAHYPPMSFDICYVSRYPPTYSE